jgi:DNA-directed RNA polymerase subunit RPC12/RpoP
VAKRTYVCMDCGTEGEANPRGRAPDRCPQCHRKRTGKTQRRLPPVHDADPNKPCAACGGPLGPGRRSDAECCSPACYTWRHRHPGVARQAFRALQCEHCGAMFNRQLSGKVAKFCGDRCWEAYRHRSRPFGEWRKDNPFQPRQFECTSCGQQSWAAGAGPIPRCCEVCDERRSYLRDRKALKVRRARIAATADGTVSRVEVFERDLWVCQLCLEPVDSELKWPDLLSASLDHVLPVAKGGKHTYSNVQLAHLMCNIRKSHRMR